VSAETPFAARLARARALIAQDSGAGPPTSLRDQVEAATRDVDRVRGDAAQVLRTVFPHRGWQEKTLSSTADEACAYVLAAILDCARFTCEHLRQEGPQPAFAQLPLRRLVCRRCIPIMPMPPLEEADRCDMCGERGVTWFVPLQVARGPVLVLGDVCPACARALGIETAA